MKRSLLAAGIAAALLTLGACSSVPNADPATAAQTAVDDITLAYTPVRAAAVLCSTGVVCSDAAVMSIVAKAIPVADTAIADAKSFILSSVNDTSKIGKWAAAASAAIEVLSKVLVTFGVVIT